MNVQADPARVLGGVPLSLGGSRQIGQRLVEAGVIDGEQLESALALQRRWHSRLGDVILAQRWTSALKFYPVLAEQFGLPFVNLLEQSPDAASFDVDCAAEYLKRLAVPWRREGEAMVVAVADPGEATFAWARSLYGDDVRFVGTSKFDIIWVVQRLAAARLTDDALNLLAVRDPEHSARTVFTRGQRMVALGIGVALVVALCLRPIATLIVLDALLALCFLATFLFKFTLMCLGARRKVDIRVDEQDIAQLDDADLPVYTVLVPMYKEPDVLPILASALRKLDYPTSKLDVKLVLEAGDIETIEAAKSLGLEAFFEIIRVPESQPKTKPKACNYALQFARGELVTIYDAEDMPEPDQLKRVVATFRKSAPEVACVQARLNYYNADENWLTRMFTLDYTLWFDFFLPALEYLRIPIPLGGTSNHFRLEVLRGIHAWDPYNVTEDADLGVRLISQGYRVSVVNSTTFEEANVSIPNWIRQRSRWLKGYMQTWLVHMRDPVHLYRSTGFRGFWGFQFFIGGGFFTALAAPVLWLIYLVWLVLGFSTFRDLMPRALDYLNLFNLLVANFFFIYMTLVASLKRGYQHLAPYALTAPFYWLLQSIAAYKGAWQLIRNPFYWEKTTHGISKYVAEQRKVALED